MIAGGVRLQPDRPVPALTIRAVRTTAVHVPMKRALGTSARRMEVAPLVLIDVDTEEGVTGRAYVFCYLPAATDAVEAIVREAAGHVKGDRIEPVALRAKLARHFRLLGVHGIVTMALAGLDGACWDARAVAAGVPLVSLLGGSARPLRAYNSNGLSIREPGSGIRDPFSELADEAEELLAEGGFDAVKLRLGYATLAEDVAAVRAVRKRVPGGTVIMSDYNQALTVDDALERGRAPFLKGRVGLRAGEPFIPKRPGAGIEWGGGGVAGSRVWRCVGRAVGAAPARSCRRALHVRVARPDRGERSRQRIVLVPPDA